MYSIFIEIKLMSDNLIFILLKMSCILLEFNKTKLNVNLNVAITSMIVSYWTGLWKSPSTTINFTLAS